jgi:hypothetical protein
METDGSPSPCRTTSRADTTPQLIGLNFAAPCIQLGACRIEISVEKRKNNGRPMKSAIAMGLRSQRAPRRVDAKADLVQRPHPPVSLPKVVDDGVHEG